jgi:hypothetical protein
LNLKKNGEINFTYPGRYAEFRDIIKVVGARLDAGGLGEVRLYWAEALPARNSINYYINAVKADPVKTSH